MRTTITLDDDLLARAGEALGNPERSAILHEGLRLIIQRDAARRLAALGGTAPALSLPERRRPTTTARTRSTKPGGDRKG